MNFQMSTLLRNNLVAQIETTIGPNARIQVRDGPVENNCAALDQGALLAEFVLGPDWSQQNGGVLTFVPVPVPAVAVGAGIAAHYRFKDAGGSACHMQGSVTATGGGGALTVDNVNIAIGQAVQITGWTITAPGA